MKKRSKLTLHRETLARLEPKLLRAAGADCTCSCCYSACCPPSWDCPVSDTCYCNPGTDQGSACLCD
jgi:hypothetical protein